MPTGGQGTGGGAVPTVMVRGWYKRRLPIIQPIPYGAASTPSAAFPPLVVPRRPVPRSGFVAFTRLLRGIAATVRLALPIVSRPANAMRRATVYITPLPHSATPAKCVPRLAIVRRAEARPNSGVVYRTTLPAAPQAPATGLARYVVVRRPEARPHTGRVMRTVPPSPMKGPRPRLPIVFRRDYSRSAEVHYSRPPFKLVTPPPGGVLPPRVVSLARKLSRGFAWVGKTLAPVVTPFTGLIARPIVAYGKSDRHTIRNRNRGLATGSLLSRLPPTPTGTAGPRLLLKTGPYNHLPNLNFREPGFTSDTFQLFVGNGSTDTFVGGMSAVPAHSNSPGMPGMYACDGAYIYICYSTNSWGRVAIGTAF